MCVCLFSLLPWPSVQIQAAMNIQAFQETKDSSVSCPATLHPMVACPCCHPSFISPHSCTNLSAEMSRVHIYTILPSGLQKGCPMHALRLHGITRFLPLLPKLLKKFNNLLTHLILPVHKAACPFLSDHLRPLVNHLLCMGGYAPLYAGIVLPAGRHFFILVVIH